MLKTSPLSLSVEDAASTSAYLKGLSERSSNLMVVAQSLFARCCLSTLPCSTLSMEELDAEAIELGHRILSHPQPAQLGMDPVLVIEIYRVLQEAGFKAAAMHSVVKRMAPELLEQPEEVQRIGRVRLIASKLAALGFAVRPAKPAKAMADTLKSPAKWFSASALEMAEIADHLLADQRPLDLLSSRILSLIALAELRNYRIDLGCVLLRTVLQLGEPCPESEDALHFIALQRRRDGRYGFSNQFVESAGAGDDQHLKIYLPLTVNAVWLHAVGELTSRRCQVAVGA
jgi:hypothetical protein